jgi:hypothetical protein
MLAGFIDFNILKGIFLCGITEPVSAGGGQLDTSRVNHSFCALCTLTSRFSSIPSQNTAAAAAALFVQLCVVCNLLVTALRRSLKYSGKLTHVRLRSL